MELNEGIPQLCRRCNGALLLAAKHAIPAYICLHCRQKLLRMFNRTTGNNQ